MRNPPDNVKIGPSDAQSGRPKDVGQAEVSCRNSDGIATEGGVREVGEAPESAQGPKWGPMWKRGPKCLMGYRLCRCNGPESVQGRKGAEVIGGADMPDRYTAM